MAGFACGLPQTRKFPEQPSRLLGLQRRFALPGKNGLQTDPLRSLLRPAKRVTERGGESPAENVGGGSLPSWGRFQCGNPCEQGPEPLKHASRTVSMEPFSCLIPMLRCWPVRVSAGCLELFREEGDQRGARRAESFRPFSLGGCLRQESGYVVNGRESPNGYKKKCMFGSTILRRERESGSVHHLDRALTPGDWRGL